MILRDLDKKPKLKILIVDLLNLFMRNFAVCPLMNSDGEHYGGVYGTLDSLKFLANLVNPDRMILVTDGKDGSKKRRSINEKYKEGRKVPKSVNRTYNWLNLEEEKEAMEVQLSRIFEYINRFPVFLFKKDETEADDIIAFICNSIYNDKEKYENIIVSTDKDFYQLVNKNTKIYSPIKQIWIDENYIKDNYKVLPRNFVLLRTLEGDKSDNIEGISGIGIKTASNLIADMIIEDKDYNINDIILFIDDLIDKALIDKNGEKFLKGRINKYLGYEQQINREKLFENYNLMSLRSYDLKLSAYNKENIVQELNSLVPRYNYIKFLFMIKRDRLHNKIEHLDKWNFTFRKIEYKNTKWNNLITGSNIKNAS